VGGDDRLRLLTARSDGAAAQLRLIDPASGQVLRVNTIPSPADCTPQAIATGATDNKTYLLWQRTDGQVQIWRYAADLSAVEAKVAFGPVGAQRPIDLGVGLDGKVRLNGRGTSASNRHTLYLWTLKADLSGAETSYVYAPPTASQQMALSVGKNCLWLLSRVGDRLQSQVAWGPYSGRTPQDLAMGFDAKARLLWNENAGGCQLWRLDPSGTQVEKTFVLGAPIPGAQGMKVGASLLTGSMWILWMYPDGRTLVRMVNPSTGAITGQYLYYTF
jgi:hypothetical protein